MLKSDAALVSAVGLQLAAAFICLGLTTTSSAASGAREKRAYRVSSYGTLYLVIPESWSENKVSVHPTELVSFLNDGVLVEISFVPPQGTGAYTLDRLYRGTVYTRNSWRELAKKGKVKMTAHLGGSNEGYCLSYKMLTPTEEGYRNRSQCAVVVEGNSLNVRADYADASRKVRKMVASMARRATFSPSGGGEAESRGSNGE